MHNKRHLLSCAQAFLRQSRKLCTERCLSLPVRESSTSLCGPCATHFMWVTLFICRSSSPLWVYISLPILAFMCTISGFFGGWGRVFASAVKILSFWIHVRILLLISVVPIWSYVGKRRSKYRNGRECLAKTAGWGLKWLQLRKLRQTKHELRRWNRMCFS